MDQTGEAPRDNASSTAARLKRAVPTVATIVAVVVFVTAGNWQRGRMHDKEALAAQFAEAERAAPLPMSRVEANTGDLRFRLVEARGRFDAKRQILLDNRVQRGRIGYHVFTPLALSDGRAVLVNRGFVPAGATRADVPVVPPPPGEVAVRGRINHPPPRYLEPGGAKSEGAVWHNLDLARFESATGLDVLPFVIEQVDGAEDGLVRDWPRPDYSGDKHRVYMLQWYAFAALAAGLWAWFTLRRRR